MWRDYLIMWTGKDTLRRWRVSQDLNNKNELVLQIQYKRKKFQVEGLAGARMGTGLFFKPQPLFPWGFIIKVKESNVGSWLGVAGRGNIIAIWHLHDEGYPYLRKLHLDWLWTLCQKVMWTGFIDRYHQMLPCSMLLCNFLLPPIKANALTFFF